MNQSLTADVVIFGGGVAGLWLLNRLRQIGLTVLLLESDALGAGQTLKSQGIIHGGMKYALHGDVTAESKAMADSPMRWQNCLNGTGEIDLRRVSVLSQNQHLWSPNRMTAKITGFVANKMLQGRIDAIDKSTYPSVFQHASFKGDVYALHEWIIDVPQLIKVLAEPYPDSIFKIDAIEFPTDPCDPEITIMCNGIAYALSAQQFIFAAGAGNEAVAHWLNQPDLAMQRRPLHMVCVKPNFDHTLYAHCLGFSQRPRLTITTHFLSDGSPIWYLGGLLAENGVTRDAHAQIKAAKKELAELFPWLDFSDAHFETFMVDRAEPWQKNGMKPEAAYIKKFKNKMVVWPTKLALTPKLADEVLKQLNFTASQCAHAQYQLPSASFAPPIWETLFAKTSIR